MDERDRLRFTLLGGPLHRLGTRLGLVREGSNTLPLGLALSALLWAPLAILGIVEGGVDRVFSLSLVAAHVRLLAAIPLFFLCESWIDPKAATFIATLRRSGMVPDGAVPRFERGVRRSVRLTDSWLPDAIALIAAVTASVYASRLPLSGSTAVFDPSRAAGALGLAADWYWLVCLPFFRFLMFRWLWRLGLWAWLLWRMARLDLRLRPTHPDGVAGLAYLEVVHSLFTPLIFAFSAIQSAALAEELSAGAPFAVVYPVLALVLAIDAVLFLGPLFVFAPRLFACRIKGLADFTELGESYVQQFDRKWLRPGAASEPELLGSNDVQSLANLYDSVAIIRNVRMVPVSLKLVWSLAGAAALPVLPLLLFEFPLHTLVEKVLSRLIGL